MDDATQGAEQEPTHSQHSANEPSARRGRRRAKKPSSPAPTASIGQSAVVLRSLAPGYIEEQHGTYVTRLSEAVRDPKNRNIALTGRYGSGKSSVLDKFEELHQDATVRLAISTLSPVEDEPAMTKTNRIQKELVKQIVYAAPKKVGKNSRFSRIAVPSKSRFFIQSAALVAVLWTVLYIFGWLPELKNIDEGSSSWLRPVTWTTLGGLVASLLTVLRIAVHGRFRIADVKAGGASLTLADQAPTYFDQFLDELVHYFDMESKDIVIFEDLDRFEDPQIFQELRELNTLLNETPRRRRKKEGNAAAQALREVLSDDFVLRLRRRLPRRWSARLLGTGEPLRFVYAVKDSLFEQLGDDSKKLAASGDAAAAETLRANRTKFFDVVIPLVPFISHRNARELLDKALKKVNVTGIDKPLVDVVARHATDMRLLQNMCNEYVVFAERLLNGDQVAPDLDASKLFALVAYKNFHLTDFELITRRASSLDALYEYKLDLVRTNIAALQVRQRELLAQTEADRAHTEVATRLGARLRLYAEARMRNNYNEQAMRYRVGERQFEAADADGYEFWSAVEAAGQVTLLANESGQALGTLTTKMLATLAPEGVGAPGWAQLDEQKRHATMREIEREIEALRGADFRSLALMPKYTVTVQRADLAAKRARGTVRVDTAFDDWKGDGDGPADYTFAELVDAVLRSDLARDLVKGGFIDQNFPLYGAQFYGSFAGVDVARFVVQSVQANKMLLDHQFTTPGAVDNLLTEVGDGFLSTAAGYNVDIIDHLLVHEDPRIEAVLGRLTTSRDDDARDFLTTYFTSGSRREALAAGLAAFRWAEVFTYLATDPGVAEDVRSESVGEALAAADPNFAYDISDEVKKFIEHNYLNMTVFLRDQSPEVARVVAAMLARVGVVIPVLAAVRELRLRHILIDEHRYKLTAHNLRTALHGTEPDAEDGPVGLDEVVAEPDVYRYCLSNPTTYLGVVADDETTQWAVTSPEVLATVLDDITVDDSTGLVETWTHDDVGRLLALTSPEGSLESIGSAPKGLWRALAGARLFDVTLANLDTYRAAFGVDEPLAAHLTAAGRIEVNADSAAMDRSEREAAAVALLNAPVLEPRTRVDLARCLLLDGPVDATLIGAEESGELFALLLAAGLVADDRASFLHFRSAGWDSIGPALLACEDITRRLEPAFVHGMVADVLADRGVAEKIGSLVASHAEEFIPDDDDAGNNAALGELAKYTDRHGIALPPVMVLRIARAGVTDSRTILRLLRRTTPAADARELVGVLVELGGEYAKFATLGEDFEVARDDLHDEVLAPLRDSGIVKTRKVKGGIKVTVVNTV